MKRLVLTIALLFLVSPAQGEVLLAEFGWNQPLPVTTPARYEFIVRESLDPRDLASLIADVTTVGITAVDAATVAEFSDVLAGSDGTHRVVYVSNAGQTPPRNNIAFNAIWSTFASPPGFRYDAHVPRLGSALFGYRITRMEHAITTQGQTVYFYGTAIPEPTTNLLVLVGGVILIASRFRC